MKNLRDILKLTLAALAAKLNIKLSALQARETAFEKGSISIRNAEEVVEALDYRMEIWAVRGEERIRLR
jgi:transcriptional regulator with XRE-family HTH domain